MNYSEEIQKASRLGDVEMLKSVLMLAPELINVIDKKLG